MVAVSALLVSCNEDELWKNHTLRDGYVALRFSAEIPDMQEVETRAVDPDGGGVQNMTLFCFDSYGLFISTATATLAPTSDLTGTFDAQVPDNTRTIHFLANQNMSEFKEDDFRGKSESEVMSVLEGSSGKMIYWARFACAPNDERKINEQLGNSIEMIRNQAQVSIANNKWETEWFTVTGFAVVNSNAFGTVAPYHPTKGYDFVWPDDADFVTLPLNDAKMSDITDVSTSVSEYIFECKNTSDDPVSVIIRGHLRGETEADDLYYRALLLDDKGEQLLIKRNFHYSLNITGALSYGQETFETATTAPATNNVWISISDEVKSVEDNEYILTVDKTSYILDEKDAGNTYTLTYSLKGKNGTTVTKADEPTISWLDGNRVAGPSIGHSFTVTNGTGEGEIRISLLPLGNNEKLEGTLLVKKGKLQRKIKVITIKKQEFTPAWVGTQVYGSVNGSNKESRAHVTVMFTIPETCPEELFPIRVLVSTNELDVRSAAGVALPVINDGDEGYGEPNGIGYKYVYTATAPGVQRIYFENVLNHSDTDEGTVKIEAEHFTTVNKTFKYSANQYSITIEGLNEYNAQNPSEENFPEDEKIYYRLVPQKRYANVQFDMQMTNLETNEPFNAGNSDEFLLYSQYLDYYKDGEESQAGVIAFDCRFWDVDASNWGSVGRLLMFMPRNPQNPTAGRGKYSIYMKTNRAVSAEVVRISSNQQGSPSALPNNNGANYTGNSYRSVTFELANYNPFRFAARVNNEGTDTSGAEEEVTTPLAWTYAPEQKVDIALDVTSFKGSDDKSVDPFGEAFEIYIDAPMLEIDQNRLAEYKLNSGKLKADPNVEGRFIYTVDADRETERQYGYGTVINSDGTEANQTGERKTLPFKTSSIVSAGDIVISSNKEKVVFFDKTFKVSNTPISGTLKYGTNGQNVPRSAFVSFERTRNGSRIGAVTVTANGQYELRLRKEYTFNWYTDEVEFHYEGTDGTMYHKTYQNLAALFASPDVVLEAAEGN